MSLFPTPASPRRTRPAYLIPLGLLAGLLAAPAEASRFALGYQREHWSGVDLDETQNPDKETNSEPGLAHLQFASGGMNNWYLDEPGFIFSLIGGMAGTEANEVEARNRAIREGRGTYTYAYGQPPPIPEGRWFRWGYTAGRWQGADTERNGVEAEDDALTFLYRRYDANIIMAPRLIGATDFYWMMGSTLSGTSLKIYRGDADQATTDYSYMDTFLDLHMGWQPRVFPWLMLEGLAGYDLIDLAGQAILGFDNYSHGYLFGAKATLGTDWIAAYYDFKRKQDPTHDHGSYSRRYVGNWSVMGVRLDLGNLFYNLLSRRGGSPSPASSGAPKS